MKEMLRPGYGHLLAQARIAKAMSQADVAAKLKLTLRQVEALEAEDAGHLPGDIFLRGFVRNYARLVDLNADEVIAPLDAEAAVCETITAHSEGVTIGSGGLKRWLLLPLLALGVFVIFVAILYQWLRQGEDTLVPQATGDAAPAVVTRPLTPPAPENVAPLPQGTPDASDASLPAVTSPAVAATPTGTAAPETTKPVASASKPIEGPPAIAIDAFEPASTQSKGASAAANTHVLRFLAARDAWVQVVDGEGKRFSKLIRAGDSDSITGMAPFKLVVGEAAEVRLSYDGHPIDLSPFIGQKVARLTLE